MAASGCGDGEGVRLYGTGEPYCCRSLFPSHSSCPGGTYVLVPEVDAVDKCLFSCSLFNSSRFFTVKWGRSTSAFPVAVLRFEF